jgi:hypothetical protein
MPSCNVASPGAGHIAAVQDEAVTAKAHENSRKANRYLMNKARGSNDIAYLCSPVTGGGIAVGRFQQIFLLAIAQGQKEPSEWARFAWQVIAAQGQTLMKDGKSLTGAEENLSELNSQARTFAEKQLPILKALQVA